MSQSSASLIETGEALTAISSEEEEKIKNRRKLGSLKFIEDSRGSLGPEVLTLEGSALFK